MSTSLKNKRNSRDTFLPIFQAVVRRLRVGFCICCCVVLQVASVLGQNENAPPAAEEDRSARKPASVQLQWSDTDQLDGQLLGYRDGLIQIESQLFKTRVGVLASLVDTVRFTHRSDARANLGLHRLLLVDGSVLVGNYVSTEAGKLRFDDYRFGELTIDVVTVAKFETNSKVGYAWNGEIKPWQLLSGTWTIDGEQRLHTSQSDSKLWLPFPLRESFSIEFEIVSHQSLDLVLATGQDPEKSYRLAKIGESWVIGTSDDFEIVEALSDRQRQLALRLSRSASTGKLTLMQGDQTLVTVSDKEEASDRSGILLQNMGHSLSMKSLRIMEYEEESTAVELPSLAASIVEPAPRSQDLLTFRDGSKLWCTIQDYSESTLKISVNQLAIERSCSVDQIASITPRTKEGSVSLGVENSEYRLQQGQSRLFGSFQLRFDPPTVHWHSNKLDQHVLLNTELPFSMQSQNRIAQAIAGAAQTSEVAYLKSGAKIPVKLERANATQTWLKIPFSTSSVHVDNRALQAIDFGPKKKKPSFTKESREMLLSVPRNLEVDHYSHALVGQNGDLLRGNLVAITEQTIEIDSRQEPLGVERRFVDTLLFLHPPTEQSRDSRAIDSSSGDTKATQSFGSQSFTGQLSLQLDDGYSISGSWIGGDANTIVVNSPELGECRVETKSIQNYLFNLPPTFNSESQASLAWSTKQLTQPRWQVSTPEQSAAAANSLIGTSAPDLSLPNSNGETVKLVDYLGKVVVLDYWATWCGPCVASIPKYVETTHRFPENQVVFFGVNSTETPESVREFLQSKSWPAFDTLFDYDGSAGRAMLVSGIPHTVVIGRDGKIAHVQVGYSPKGADELYEVIEKLVK